MQRLVELDLGVLGLAQTGVGIGGKKPRRSLVVQNPIWADDAAVAQKREDALEEELKMLRKWRKLRADLEDEKSRDEEYETEADDSQPLHDSTQQISEVDHHDRGIVYKVTGLVDRFAATSGVYYAVHWSDYAIGTDLWQHATPAGVHGA
eukprot:1482333-Prymnesium_polylepis.1